ncbi:MAG: hypothetical protein HY904_22970 [Deltaproteobacteria bacterium]|nr:hypothetical protein [Deltaproteobacteria bacterium]
MRRNLAWWLCAVGLLGCQCRRPATPPAPPPDALERVPADVHAALWGERASAATGAAAALLARLDGTRPGAARAQLAEQLGFDATTPEGLAAAGIRPEGPWAAAVLASGFGLWLPVQDAGALTTALHHLGKDLQGADRVEEFGAGEWKARQYARPFGSRQVPVFCVGLGAEVAVLTTGKDCRAQLEALARVVPAASLGRSAAAAEARPRAGTAPVRFLVQTAYAAKLGEKSANAGKLVRLAAGGVTATSAGAAWDAWLALTEERRAGVRAGLFPPGGAVPLTAVVDADAVALGRGALAWDTARSVADGVDPTALAGVRKQAGRAGVDLEEGILGLTDGNYAGALYTLEPTAWAEVLRGGWDVRSQLMRVAPFVVVMRPGPGVTPQTLVDRIRERMRARGVTLTAHPSDGAVEVANFPGGPAWKRWFLATERGVVLVGGGSDARFLRAVARLRGTQPAAALDAATTAAFAQEGASTLLLRTHQAAEVLDGVLRQDLGTDAEALSIQSILRKVRAQLGALAGVRLVLAPDGDGLRLTLAVDWSTAAGPK